MSAAAIDGWSAFPESHTYDVCVLTGDYRAATYGPYDATLAGMAHVRAGIKDYGDIDRSERQLGVMNVAECDPSEALQRFAFRPWVAAALRSS